MNGKDFKVVIGANYGDEGKGLVSGSLAREAYINGKKTLTIFYNGTSQRAHTFCKRIFRSVAPGSIYGSDTYYDKDFVVDPISLWISGEKPIIHPNCRVILPCDVIKNRNLERQRGQERHGSCGFGLFECVKRYKEGGPLNKTFGEIMHTSPYALYKYLKYIEKVYGKFDDDLYNMDNLMMCFEKFKNHIPVKWLAEILDDYDTIIFEGGQGLLLDQNNAVDFPYLTPSSTGSTQIAKRIQSLFHSDDSINLYYVTRSYMTRHGAGPMEMECKKEDIHPNIIDKTNEPNEFQGELRFGKINLESLRKRIDADCILYPGNIGVQKNIVITQLNYTNGCIDTTEGMLNINDLKWGSPIRLWVSDQEDYMERSRLLTDY